MNIFSNDSYFSSGLSLLLSEKDKIVLCLTDSVILDDGFFFLYVISRDSLNTALNMRNDQSLLPLFFEFNVFSYNRKTSVKEISKVIINFPRAMPRPLKRKLTPCETAVITGFYDGKTVEEIAAEYNMHVKTVSKHKVSALHKLNLKSTALLIHSIKSWIDIIIFYIQNQKCNFSNDNHRFSRISWDNCEYCKHQ